MQYIRFVVLLTACFFFTNNLHTQSVGIHAFPVGTWENPVAFSPEYHYNSVAVFLLNEEKLQDLFDPNSLSRAERKKTGVRSFDELESLYFSLELPNPVQHSETIEFPLYAFDINRQKSFKIPKNQGKIIDRISDEELNGRTLNATARIEAITNNQMLFLAYRISSTINRILTDRLFKNPGIIGAMERAQLFFEDKYKGKITSEFVIPILPGNEDFDYIIHSANIYQLKWNFQSPVRTYKDNIWSDLDDKTSVTEEELQDRPSRLSRYNNHPYLVVIRYKSAYSLPEKHRLQVEISEEYLNERLYNLQEFQKNSVAYRTEETFLTQLRDALELRHLCDDFRRVKSKGQPTSELALQIAQKNFDLQHGFRKAQEQFKTDSVYNAYFQEKYGTVYYKLFKQVDQFFFLDDELKSIGALPGILREIRHQGLATLTPEKAYAYLEQLEKYRRITAEVNQVEGDFYYKIREQIADIEEFIYPQLFNVSALLDPEKCIAELNTLQEQYPACQHCLESSKEQINGIREQIQEQLRKEINGLQIHQLRYLKCFSDIQLTAAQKLENWQSKDTTSNSPNALLTSFEEKITELNRLTMEFGKIDTVDTTILSTEQLRPVLEHYQQILQQISHEVCQLYHGELLTKDALDCLPEKCALAVP